MKKLTSLLILIILFIGGIQKKAYSQYNPFTNCYNCDGETSADMINLLEETIKDNSYDVCFMQTKYAEGRE